MTLGAVTLRPIGTEFDYLARPDRHSSACEFTVFRYRVVAHDEAMTLGGAPRTMERVEVVGSRSYPVSEFKFREGALEPVPPPEVAHLL